MHRCTLEFAVSTNSLPGVFKVVKKDEFCSLHNKFFQKNCSLYFFTFAFRLTCSFMEDWFLTRMYLDGQLVFVQAKLEERTTRKRRYYKNRQKLNLLQNQFYVKKRRKKSSYAIFAHGVRCAFVSTSCAIIELILRASFLRLKNERVRVLVDLLNDGRRLEGGNGTRRIFR